MAQGLCLGILTAPLQGGEDIVLLPGFRCCKGFFNLLPQKTAAKVLLHRTVVYLDITGPRLQPYPGHRRFSLTGCIVHVICHQLLSTSLLTVLNFKNFRLLGRMGMLAPRIDLEFFQLTAAKAVF